MDDPADDLQPVSYEFARQKLLECFEMHRSPQNRRRLPKIKSGVLPRERGGAGTMKAVAEPYLLYRSAISLATQVDRLFEQRFKSHGIELAVWTMEAVAELGTVLVSPPTQQNRSATACLKRAFGRISAAIEAAEQLERQKVLSSDRCKGLSKQLFEIRDGIIVLYGDVLVGQTLADDKRN